jgi:hypothetical protein
MLCWVKMHAGSASAGPQQTGTGPASMLAGRMPSPDVPSMAAAITTGGVGAARLSASSLLALHRQAGNAAVNRLIGALRPVPIFRQGPSPPAAPAVLQGATPVERIADGFRQGTPDAIDQAWGLLNGRAMFDLLPMLATLKGQGHWGAISTGASGRGGPRMATAVHVVNLKTKGSPITKDELRDLIDRLATVNPDQRADMLRFIGKYVVITIEGIDLDISYVAGTTTASAAVEVKAAIDEARFFINEYAATLSDPQIRTGADVEQAIETSLRRQGMGIATAGSTSSSGAVTIAPQPMSKAQPIITRSTEIHEGVHAHHVGLLQQRFGAGTPAFDQAFNNAKDWVADEINARKAEIRFLMKVLLALKQLEKMVR